MKIGRSLNANAKCPTCAKHNLPKDIWPCAFCSIVMCAYCYGTHTEEAHPNENVVPSEGS